MRARTRQIRSFSRWALALLLAASAAARAVAVADPAAPETPPPKTLALLTLTFAKGDKALAELVKGVLADTKRFHLVKAAASAELVGKLSFAHPGGATLLDLVVTAKGDAPVVHARQMVSSSRSVIDGAQALVAQVTDALDGKHGPPPSLMQPDDAAPSVPPGSSPRTARVPAPSTATSSRASRDDDASDDPADLRPSPRAKHPLEREEGDEEDDERRLDFVVGPEAGWGPWSLNAASIATSDSTGYDLSGYAPVFARTLDGRAHYALGLHGGLRFLGYCAFEVAYQGSRWSGGASTLWGPRLSFYPLGAIWPEHKVDVGLELGAGHSFLVGAPYDASGGYLSAGLNVEYPLTRWLGVVAYYRFFATGVSRFYVDYANNRYEDTGATAYWNTFGLGLNVHFSRHL